MRSIALRTWPLAYGSILSLGQITYMLERMYNEDVLTSQLRSGHEFLLAEERGTAIGLAGAETEHSGTGLTRLHKLYVVPASHGHGVGGALLKAVEGLALRAGSIAVELNVNKYNPARAFYARHGYLQVGEEVIDIGGGYVMDDFVLRKALQGSR